MTARDTLRDLRIANAARDLEWNIGKEPLSLSFRGNELGAECGEALGEIKSIERARYGIPGTKTEEEARSALAKELADVIICCDLIAMDTGLDLDEAIRAKFNATSEKHDFGTRMPPGSAKRFTVTDEQVTTMGVALWKMHEALVEARKVISGTPDPTGGLDSELAAAIRAANTLFGEWMA